VARLADDQDTKALVGLYTEMLGMRQQEIACSLDTLQQTTHTLLDAATGAASEDEDNAEGERAVGAPELVWAMSAVLGDNIEPHSNL